MKSGRVLWMLAVAAGLAVARWFFVPGGEHSAGVGVAAAAATPSASRLAMRPSEPRIAGLTSTPPADWSAGTREPESGPPGDAFRVRGPAAPVTVAAPPPPSPSSLPPPKPFVGPPLPVPEPPPPAPAPPPYRVIGGWRDERGPSVFLSGPAGVVQARAGDELGSAWQVVQVSPRQVLLRPRAGTAEVAIVVPAGLQAALAPSP